MLPEPHIHVFPLANFGGPFIFCVYMPSKKSQIHSPFNELIPRFLPLCNPFCGHENLKHNTQYMRENVAIPY